MDEDRRRLATTAAVFTGALILTGPLTFAIVFQTVGALASLAGVESLYESTAATILVGVPAVLLAGEVVTEITALQLYGIGALNRGTRRQRLVRHLALSLVVVAAVIFLLAFATGPALDAGEPSVAVGLGLAALALLWGAGRTVQAFRSGYAGGS